MGPSDPRNQYARTTSGVNGVVDGSGLGGNMNEKNFSSTVAPVTEDGTNISRLALPCRPRWQPRWIPQARFDAAQAHSGRGRRVELGSPGLIPDG